MRLMFSTGDIFNGVLTDEWSGINTKTGIECLIPDRTSSKEGGVFSTRSSTSFSTNMRMACSNLSDRKQRIINNLCNRRSSEPSVSMGSAWVSGLSLSYQSLHGPGLDAMCVQMLSKGPLRLDAARISSQASWAIQLGWRSVGSKSESVGTGVDRFPGYEEEERRIKFL